MPIIACPHCGMGLDVMDAMPGNEVICGQCDQSFLLGVDTGLVCRPAKLPASGYALASLVLGTTSVVSFASCWLGFCNAWLVMITGPLAIILGGRALAHIRIGVANPSSAGLAKAGIICGIISLVVLIAFPVLLFIGIIAGD